MNDKGRYHSQIQWYAPSVNLQADRSAEKKADYEVTACAARDLISAELETCFAIINKGGAVNTNTMKRDLPRSSLMAVARNRKQIVGVGVIKPVRPGYAAKTARNSGVAFPPETLELGYVAVDDDHRGHGLSHRIVEVLLARHVGRLFATTDDEWMKKTLTKAGFVMKGKQWQGQRGTLSFWDRI